MGITWALLFILMKWKFISPSMRVISQFARNGPWKPVSRFLIVNKSSEIVAGRDGLWTYWTKLDHWLLFHSKTCPPLSQRMESRLKLAPANCFHSWRPKWVLKWNAYLQVLRCQHTIGNGDSKRTNSEEAVVFFFFHLPTLSLPPSPLSCPPPLPPSHPSFLLFFSFM